MRSYPSLLVVPVGMQMAHRCPLPLLWLDPSPRHHLLAVVSFHGVGWALVQPVQPGYMGSVRTVALVPGPESRMPAGLAERE